MKKVSRIVKTSMLAIAMIAGTNAWASNVTAAVPKDENVVLGKIYKIDPLHTFPRFSYNHLGFSKQVSSFSNTSGVVSFDTKEKTGVVNVTIDMTSVNTGSKLFDEHIQAPELLDTKAFPYATFKSKNVLFTDDKPSEVHGDLTIKGITKPVVLKVTHFVVQQHPMLKKEAIGANATVDIKRSDFNASKSVPYVSDEVTIDISLEAVSD